MHALAVDGTRNAARPQPAPSTNGGHGKRLRPAPEVLAATPHIRPLPLDYDDAALVGALRQAMRLAGVPEEAQPVEQPSAKGQELLAPDRFRLVSVEQQPVRLLAEFTGGWWFALTGFRRRSPGGRALTPEMMGRMAPNRTV